MKRGCLCLLFFVALVVAIIYHEESCNHQKRFKRYAKKCRKQRHHWQDKFHDMMPF